MYIRYADEIRNVRGPAKIKAIDTKQSNGSCFFQDLNGFSIDVFFLKKTY